MDNENQALEQCEKLHRLVAQLNDELRAEARQLEDWAQRWKMFENLGLVEVERTNGRIDTLILTESGAAKVKEMG